MEHLPLKDTPNLLKILYCTPVVFVFSVAFFSLIWGGEFSIFVGTTKRGMFRGLILVKKK